MAGDARVQMIFYVYILKSLKDGRHYTGYTKDLERRLNDHNRGKSRSVQKRGPFELVYKETFNSKEEAVDRERQIKNYKGGNAFKRLIEKNSVDPIV